MIGIRRLPVHHRIRARNAKTDRIRGTISQNNGSSLHLLDPQSLDSLATHVQTEPFSFLIRRDMPSESTRIRLDTDFPRYPGAGLFSDESDDCGPSINALIEDLIHGNLVAFQRRECSYHGHLPFAGERRGFQAAWLTRENEKPRTTQRGRLSRLSKKLFGAIDRWIGAGRNHDAAHLD